MSSVSARLVDHALAVEWAAMDASVRTALRNFLHDSLAVGVAGRNGANADAVMTMAQSWGSGGAAPVLGRPGSLLPPASAAFVNAFQIHCQEFDCVHEPAVLHPMATVLAACMAELARQSTIGGEHFLAGLAAGIDIATGLGLASGPVYFFRPATAGIFGCVLAIARMTRMDATTARDALGHALSFASGTMQPHVEGMPALPIQVGNAARGAIVAIDLARAGVRGVEHPVEGPFGYFALLEQEGDAKTLLDGLGEPGARVKEVSWKPFPTGRAGHGGIVALQSLIAAHGVSAENLLAYRYRAPSLIHRLVGRPAKPDMAPGYARLCLPWLAAVTLTYGKVALEHFTPEFLGAPGLLALAKRITVEVNDNPDPAAFAPGEGIATMADGRLISAAIEHQLGSPAFPLTCEQHLAKARDCLAFGGMEQREEALTRCTLTIDEAPDAQAALAASGIFG